VVHAEPLVKTSLYAGKSGECQDTCNGDNSLTADNQQATCVNRESSETIREAPEMVKI